MKKPTVKPKKKLLKLDMDKELIEFGKKALSEAIFRQGKQK